MQTDMLLLTQRTDENQPLHEKNNAEEDKEEEEKEVPLQSRFDLSNREQASTIRTESEV